VQQLLSLNSDLRFVYELKEGLITGTNVQVTLSKKICLLKAKTLNIPELNQALITFEKWEEEITNYHRHRFTNAAVEGRKKQ